MKTLLFILLISASSLSAQSRGQGTVERLQLDLRLARARAGITNLGEKVIVFDHSQPIRPASTGQPPAQVLIDPLEAAFTRELHVITLLPQDGSLAGGAFQPIVVNSILMAPGSTETNSVHALRRQLNREQSPREDLVIRNEVLIEQRPGGIPRKIRQVTTQDR